MPEPVPSLTNGLSKDQGPLPRVIRPESEGYEVVLAEKYDQWKRPGLQINRDLGSKKQKPCS